MFKNYVDARDWLESFIPFVYGKEELGLSRIENLLKLLGNPQKKFKSILVGGTAGKGSTAFYIARLLQFSESVNQYTGKSVSQSISKAGKKNTDYTDILTYGLYRPTDLPTHQLTNSPKIGLHVSPHLIYIGERMQILQGYREQGIGDSLGDNAVPVKRLVGLVNEIKPVIDDIKSKQPELAPSYFEILVALSFLYFAKEKVDWAVVEVGLGGRLDATNILMPEISVITNVGLDHTELLGETVEKIAKEKAGIIKEGLGFRVKGLEKRKREVLVVTGAVGKALKVIEKEARLASATVIELKFSNVSESKRAKSNNAVLIKYSTLSDKNSLDTDIEQYISRHYYRFRSQGRTFDVFNKNMAFLTVLALMSLRAKRSNLNSEEIATSRKAGLAMTLDEEDVKKAFSGKFIGRFEEIEENVVVDGAHNTDKMKALIDFIKKYQVSSIKYQVVLVVAFKKGKNWKEMIDLLMNDLSVKKIIATQYFATTDMGKGSAVDPEEIARYVASIKYKVVSIKTIKNSQEAVFEAINECHLALGTGDSKNSTKGQGLKANGFVLVTGSLYLVGEARTLWKLPSFT